MAQPTVLFLQSLYLGELAGGRAGVLFSPAINGLTVMPWVPATEAMLAPVSTSLSTLMIYSSMKSFPLLPDFSFLVDGKLTLQDGHFSVDQPERVASLRQLEPEVYERTNSVLPSNGQLCLCVGPVWMTYKMTKQIVARKTSTLTSNSAADRSSSCRRYTR